MVQRRTPRAILGKLARLAGVLPPLAALAVGLGLTQIAATITSSSSARETEHRLDLLGQTMVEEIRSHLAAEMAALSGMAAETAVEPPTDADGFKLLAMAHGIPGDAVWYHDLGVRGSADSSYRWPVHAEPILAGEVMAGIGDALIRSSMSRQVARIGSSTEGGNRLAVVQPVLRRDRTEATTFLISVIDLDAVAARTSVGDSDEIVWASTMVDGVERAEPEPHTHHEYLILEDVAWKFVIAPGPGYVAATGLEMVWISGAAGSMAFAGLVFLASRRRREERDIALLVDLNREKDRFLLKLAHEIRTPLTAVVGFLDVLRNHHDLSAAERGEFLEHAQEEAEEISAAVHDVLVAARHELMLVAHPTDLGAEAETVARHVERGGGKTLRLDIAGEVRAMGDPLRVRQIIRNLLSNAIRYGGPNIGVSAYRLGDWAVLLIADDGPGLPPGVSAVLEASEGGAPALGEAEGLGLGLTVATTLATRMGGSLTYRRTDQVTVMELRLAATEAAGNARPLKPADTPMTFDSGSPARAAGRSQEE